VSGPGGDLDALPQRMQSPADAPTVRQAGSRYPLAEDLTLAAKQAFMEVKQHLHTGILDWVVTDADTRAVMAALRRLGYAELVAVVHQLGEYAEGGSNLLAKFYSRGLEGQPDLVGEWRKLLYEKLVAATKDGMLPDLEKKFSEYERAYVPESVLDKGF
jgi:hypothetical protein